MATERIYGSFEQSCLQCVVTSQLLVRSKLMMHTQLGNSNYCQGATLCTLEWEINGLIGSWVCGGALGNTRS